MKTTRVNLSIEDMFHLWAVLSWVGITTQDHKEIIEITEEWARDYNIPRDLALQMSRCFLEIIATELPYFHSVKRKIVTMGEKSLRMLEFQSNEDMSNAH